MSHRNKGSLKPQQSVSDRKQYDFREVRAMHDDELDGHLLLWISRSIGTFCVA